MARQSTATRAKDSDRDDACRILDGALIEGQLSMAEHKERISAATSAITLGDLHALLADLQTASAPVQLPTLTPRLRFPRWAAAAALAGAVLVGMGLGWGVYGNTSSPLSFTSDPGAKPDGVAPVVLTPPRQLQSLGGLTGLLEQMRQKFGDTIGYQLVVYPDYAVLERPDPNEDRRTLRYSYHGGWDDPSSSARGGSDRPVDLSRFDTKALVGVLRGAPETLGVKPAEVKSTYLIFTPSGDETAPPDTLSIAVYVSSDYGSGSLTLNPDGSIKRINYA